MGEPTNNTPPFDGSDYRHEFDHARLTGQLKRVYECMKIGVWRTLEEIATITGDPQSSVSAQLRHLRKEKFGNHTVDKRPRGDREHGLFEYRVTSPTKENEPINIHHGDDQRKADKYAKKQEKNNEKNNAQPVVASKPQETAVEQIKGEESQLLLFK